MLPAEDVDSNLAMLNPLVTKGKRHTSYRSMMNLYHPLRIFLKSTNELKNIHTLQNI
jgi:hypothetical protein